MEELIKKNMLGFSELPNGSARELDTQLIIAKEVQLAPASLFVNLLQEVDEMQKLLISTLNKLEKSR